MQFSLLFLFLACTNAKSTKRRDDTYEYEDPKEEIEKEIETNRINETRAAEYLSQFGYIGPGKLLAEGEESGGVMKRAISDFQDMAGLSKTGALDEETMKEMEADRCGVPDVQDMTDGSLLKWKKDRITYSIESFTTKVPEEQIRQAVRDAYNAWSEVIPLEFEEAPAGTGDIKAHADCLVPFDGEGHTLAHALKGNIAYLHFDDDEKWTYKDESKLKGDAYKDLYAVAIHEVGHTLSMLHLKNPKSVMYFKYQSALDENGKYKLPVLSQDDIKYAQELYGKRTVGKPKVRVAEATVIKPASKGCEDSHPRCSEWSNRGECTIDPIYMNDGCKRSCGLCNDAFSATTVNSTAVKPITSKNTEKATPEICVNENKCCGTWAAEGLCATNDLLCSKCRASCGACIPQYDVGDWCEDCNPTCSDWESSECTTDPNYMHAQCRRTCGLCNDVFSGGSWNARSGMKKYPKIGKVLVRSGRMAIISRDEEKQHSIHLWSMRNEENPTLLYSCPEFVNDALFGEELIPGTTLVAHIPGHNRTYLAVYDVSTCVDVFHGDIGITLKSIKAGKEEFVVKGENGTLTYSYKKNQVTLVKKLYDAEKSKISPSVSDNGLVAYKGSDGVINIYSMREKAVVSTVNGESGTSGHWLTPNGAFLVVRGTHISVYEVTSGIKIASTPLPKNHGIECLSDDARCFAHIGIWTKIIAVTCFDIRSGNNENSVQFAYTFPNSDEAKTGSRMFRKISGVQHFQYITNNGILRLFRINEKQKKWDLLA